jgi:hypothetical protein
MMYLVTGTLEKVFKIHDPKQDYMETTDIVFADNQQEAEDKFRDYHTNKGPYQYSHHVTIIHAKAAIE